MEAEGIATGTLRLLVGLTRAVALRRWADADRDRDISLLFALQCVPDCERIPSLFG